ncbi:MULTISPECIES: hypothetical protein [unclassified Streptomyces]|uniref:hypothetical protein n=1 Tax=unclassified Streptomyces TaxID=2593676 RepID=UPI0037947FF1
MSRKDLASVQLEKLEVDFHHRHRLLDPSARGVQRWEVTIGLDGQRVGTLHAVRALYWKSDNLRERLDDEQSFSSLVAEQVLNSDGQFSAEFEEFTEAVSSLLVIDRLDLQEQEPYADPLLVAAVVAAVVDRLTDNYFAVVLPNEDASVAGAALLAEAGRLLAARSFSDELQVIDTALAAPEEAARRVRGQLLTMVRSGPDAHEGGEGAWEDEEDGEDGQDISVRTAAVLRLALDELAAQAWEDVAEFGDRPVGKGQGLVLGSLPRVTWSQGAQWRRQMARCFDDLAADLAPGARSVTPGCTGEEMALHLGIARARSLTLNRPALVDRAVAELPEGRDDYDWNWCSSVLFEDHDVLMLFDASLDGIEDSGNDINQAMGMANLASADWFEPFDPEESREPGRGFRHS